MRRCSESVAVAKPSASTRSPTGSVHGFSRADRPSVAKRAAPFCLHGAALRPRTPASPKRQTFNTGAATNK
jgi:hypothetical protein